MPVTIKLTNVSDPDSTRELVFNQRVITIGRDTASTLTLPDPLVSKHHARIEEESSGYRILDLKSTNATYLNGEKLVPERGYELHQQDVVKIAGYLLELGSLEQPRISPEPAVNPATTFSQSSSSPSESDKGGEVQAASPGALVQQWSKLKGELVDIARYLDKIDAKELTNRNEQLSTLCDDLQAENKKLKEQLEEALRVPPPVVQDSAPDSALPPIPPGQMHGILLQAILRLARGQLSFRSEFLGMTVLRDSGPIPVDFPTAEEAVRYFVDPSLTDVESTTRLGNLRKATDQIFLHVIGVLEGYRQSVEEGTRSLLQKIDPAMLRKEVANSKFKLGPMEIPYKFVPFLLPFGIVKLSIRRHHDLLLEDRGVLEKRYFRPGFIHGYEACTSQGTKETESRRENVSRKRTPGQ